MFAFATKFSPEAANFEKAVFSGYENAELYLTPTRLMSWRSLSKICRSYDLNYVVHFPTTGKASPQTCEEIVALCRDIHCQIITVHEDNLVTAQHVSNLDPNIRLAVENQHLSFDQLDSWMNSYDSVTLNIDYLWRETLQGCELSELISVVTRLLHHHRERICNIHLSGFEPSNPVRRPLIRSRDSVIRLWNVLSQENYRGFLVDELDIEFQRSEVLKGDLAMFLDWQSEKGFTNLVESTGLIGPQSQVPETF